MMEYEELDRRREDSAMRKEDQLLIMIDRRREEIAMRKEDLLLIMALDNLQIT